MGYRDEDGFLWFVGRKDDVISSAGYRIGPGEIEDSLLGHPAVLQAAVIGKPDELRGQIVKAFVVLGAGPCGEPGAGAAKSSGRCAGGFPRTSTRAKSSSSTNCR